MKEHREYQLGKLGIWLGFILLAYWATLGYLGCSKNASDINEARAEYWRGRVDGLETVGEK